MAHNTLVQVIMNLGLIGFNRSVVPAHLYLQRFSLRLKKKKAHVSCIIIPVLINSHDRVCIFGETNYGILFTSCSFLYQHANS